MPTDKRRIRVECASCQASKRLPLGAEELKKLKKENRNAKT